MRALALIALGLLPFSADVRPEVDLVIDLCPASVVVSQPPTGDDCRYRADLWDTRDAVRLHAARRLGIAPTLSPQDIDWLVDALEDAHPGIRSIAATGLRRDEAQGMPRVVPGLLDACADPVQDVRWAAVEALTDHFHAWPHDILEAWTRALADSSDDVKAIAANCIETAGPAALDAIPALEAAMDADPGPFLEWELSDALRAVEGR